MARGGYVAETIELDKKEIERQLKAGALQWKYFSQCDTKPNGRVVLLIDNETCRRSVKMLCGTEVHIGYCRNVEEFDKNYRTLEYDAVNIVGPIPHEVEELLMKRIRRKK